MKSRVQNVNRTLCRSVESLKLEILNWRERWIAPRGLKESGTPGFRARRRVRITNPTADVVLRISAESIYQLWINGHFVGTGPARGTHTLAFADRYELGQYLHPGENWVAAFVYCAPVATFKAVPVRPALFMQIDGGPDTGDAGTERWQVQPALEWRADVPMYTFQTGPMEWRDLRQEPAGWLTGDDSGEWMEPEFVSDDERIGAKQLRSRDIPLLRESRYQPTVVCYVASTPPLGDRDDVNVARIMTEESHRPHESAEEISRHLVQRQPISLRPRGGDGTALGISFEREIVGALELDIDGPAGTIIDVGYEEELKDLRILPYVQPGPDATYRFADRIILPGSRVKIPCSVQERGYRMVQLTVRDHAEAVTVHAVTAIDRRYPAEPQAAFQCSDPELNAIWTACAATLSACATDMFVDCPWRENAFWVNDLLVENVTWLQAFGDGRINARAFRLAVSEKRENDLIPAVCPAPIDPRTGKDILIFPFTNVLMPEMIWDYWMYTGDEALVCEVTDVLIGIFRTVSLWEDEEGLLIPPESCWNFVDWAFEFCGLDLHAQSCAMVNWAYVIGLKRLADLLAALGPVDPAADFYKRADRVAAGIEKRFWIPAERRYREMRGGNPEKRSTQLTHALALLSGLVPRQQVADVANGLLCEDFIAPELYLTCFILRALAEGGAAPAALDIVRRYWTPIIRVGSPTVWEANVHQHGKEAFGGSGSLCHGFATSPISFFQTVLLGVTPIKPGFAVFRLQPNLCGLSYVSGAVPTPHGDIQVNLTDFPNRLDCKVTVPSNTVAMLPDGRQLTAGSHSFSREHTE